MALCQRAADAGRRAGVPGSGGGRPYRGRAGLWGKTEQAVRYVALSRALSPQRLLEVVRAHWSVENQLHWHLDVSFDEDASRTRKDYAPENLSLIRRIALDILRAHPDKRSIRRKMNLARLSRAYFNELFAYMR